MEDNKWPNRMIILTLCSLSLLFVGLLLSREMKIYERLEIANKGLEIKQEKEVFQIWTIAGDLEESLNELVKEYEETYPNIQFNIKAFKQEVYNEALLNGAATNSFPDMFYTWGDYDFKELIKLGVVRDITESIVAENLEDQMVENALENYTVAEKHYGVPVFGWNMVLYCNEELFERYNLSYPTSYRELLKVVEVFKSQDVVPFALSGTSPWMLSMFYMSLALDDGSVKIVEDLTRSSLFFKQMNFRRAATLLEELIELEPWPADCMSISDTMCTYDFTRGEAAMLLSGSWNATIIEDENQSMIKDKVKVIRFPTSKLKLIEEGIGGYCDGFALSKRSKFSSEDIEEIFLDMTRKLSDKAVLEKGLGLPIYKHQDLEKTDFNMIKACLELFPYDDYHMAYDKLLSSQVVTKYNEAFIEFIQRNMDAEEFIEYIAYSQSRGE